MFGLSEKEVRKIVQEELKKELGKELEKKLEKELEYYVEADEVKEIVEDVVEKEKKSLEDSWLTKRNTEEKVLREINGNVGNIVNRKLEDMVREQVKYIEDKLLVELARQAMALDKDKNTQTIYS